MIEQLETRQLLSAGDLDTSFANGGSQIPAPIDTYASASALQLDGKLLVAATETPFSSNASQLSITRYNPDGSVDATFGGGDGIITDSALIPRTMAVEADGKILVAGLDLDPIHPETVLARYTSTGALDTSFGTSGYAKLSTAIDSYSSFQILQANGKVMLASGSYFDGAEDLYVTRFNSNGTLDLSYSGDGIATISSGTGDQAVGAIANSDGSVLFVGDQLGNSETDLFVAKLTSSGDVDANYGIRTPSVHYGYQAVAQGSQILVLTHDNRVYRLNADASIDTSFGGGDGFVTVGNLHPQDLDVRPDGKFVVSWVDSTSDSPGNFFNALIFSSDGALETTAKVQSFAAYAAVSTVIQSDNKILLASSGGSESDLEVLRLTAAGAVDTSYSGDGVAIDVTGKGGGWNDVAIQSDGKIVAVGYTPTGANDFSDKLIVRRFNSTGTLDTTFANGGTLLSDLGWGSKLIIQPDGKLLIGAPTAVIRLNSNGTFDSTFGGGDGIANYAADVMVRASDGKIYVGSGSTVRRLNSDGSLDTTFGASGVRTLTGVTPATFFKVYDLDLQSDGKLVATGYAERLTGEDNSYNASGFGVVRLTSGGAIDTGFADQGLFFYTDDDNEVAYAAAVQSDGKIVIAGNDRDSNLIFIRLNSDGSYDSNFGVTGNGITGDGLGWFYVQDLAVQSDGKIVVAGGSRPFENGDDDMLLMRLNSDGTMDASFAGNGSRTYSFAESTPYSDREEFAEAFAIDSSGRFVLAGRVAGRLAIARVQGGGSSDRAQLSSDGELIINGSSGNDTINVALSGSNMVTTVNGVSKSFPASSVKNFTITGVEGDDTINVSSAITIGGTISGGTGNDTISDGSGNSQIYGGEGDDLLSDGAGNDFVAGNSGNDTVIAGLGNDRYGATVVDYSARTADLTLDLEGLGLQPSGQAGESDEIFASQVKGGSGNDLIVGDNNDDVLIGGKGNDTLRGNGGNDALFGEDGDDQLEGGDGNDFLSGGNNNDTLYGQNDNDTLDGGLGADFFQGGSGVDLADYQFRSEKLNISLDNVANDGAAGEGDNVSSDIENINGGSGADRIVATAQNNSLQGNGGNDTIYAGDGDDTVVGGAGADNLFGQDGNDTIYALDGTKDTLDGGAGTDTAQRDTGSVADSVTNIEVFGGASNKLTGFAFDDTNDNAQFDSGEKKTGGKTVFLDTNGNGVLDAGEQSTVTDSSGNFTFSNLTDGTYHVRRVFPTGWTYSTALIDVNVAGGETISNLIIGSRATSAPAPQVGSISGFTFDDTNFDGEYEPGEPKTSGKTVFIDTNGNDKLDAGEKSTVTGSSGAWSFNNLPAGTYQIRRIYPSGYTQSTPVLDVTIGAGQNPGNFAIGSKPISAPTVETATLYGFTFDDTNTDGVFEYGEKMTASKTVFLDTNNNGKLDAGETSVVTGSDGRYKFTGLAAGTYHVRRVFPNGYTYSTAPIDITVSAGQTVEDLAIGSKPISAPQPQTASIAGFAFNDTNTNGQYDTGEQKTGGKTVFLDTNNNGKLDSGESSMVTDSSGNFSFTGLSAGTYHVRRVFPSGYTYSTPLIDLALNDGDQVSNVSIGSKPTA